MNFKLYNKIRRAYQILVDADMPDLATAVRGRLANMMIDDYLIPAKPKTFTVYLPARNISVDLPIPTHFEWDLAKVVGKKLDAVKAYKDRTGSGLYEAKCAIEKSMEENIYLN